MINQAPIRFHVLIRTQDCLRFPVFGLAAETQEQKEAVSSMQPSPVYTIWVASPKVEQSFPSGGKHTNTAHVSAPNTHTHTQHAHSRNVQSGQAQLMDGHIFELNVDVYQQSSADCVQFHVL